MTPRSTSPSPAVCAAALLCTAFAASCAEPAATTMSSTTKMPSALATLAPTQGSSVRGTATFREMQDHVMVDVRVTGLKPNAEHGFHVHEKGDCSSPDGESAGEHFNPDGKPHGPQSAPHHVGDIPNLKADASGVATQQFVLNGVSIGKVATGVLSRGVIVHASPDDYRSQPAGNSGPRLACGVIVAQ